MQSILITTNDADNDHSQQTVAQYERMLIVLSAVMSALILLPFLSVALHDSGTRNALSGP
jgi:hypothetical protein